MSARRRNGTFATWCGTDAPYKLGLDPDKVEWICHVMSNGAEMHGVETWGNLERALKLRRTKLRWPDDLSWHRVTLAARVMWRAYQGRV